jgi:hypothetical protein
LIDRIAGKDLLPGREKGEATMTSHKIECKGINQVAIAVHDLEQVGGVQLELVQPVEGPSVYRDWLEEHGEGLHHLNFLVDDVDQAVAALAKQGFPSMQGGKFGPPEQRGAFNYVDVWPLRSIWEPVHLGEEIGAEPTMLP